MKISLVSFTPHPLRAIAIPYLNMGAGRSVENVFDISREEAADCLTEIMKSHLKEPLNYASFNFLWEDFPLFMRAHLVRKRIGWAYAERSMRMDDATKRNPVDNYDWDAMPTLKDAVGSRAPYLKGTRLKVLADGEMRRQMNFYHILVNEGVSPEDARNFIGVWYPTTMQTSCTFGALREMLAVRLSCQAHPYWQKAANQIKQLVRDVSPELADTLVDICEMNGRCVWKSKIDRTCEDCVKRGWNTEHIHTFDRWTKVLGDNSQCGCGIMRPLLIEGSKG